MHRENLRSFCFFGGNNLKFSKTLLITAIAALAPIASHAASITSNPTMSVDGLTFNNFGCTISNGGIYATPDHCSQIKVNTITQPGNGIEFTSGFFAGPFSVEDATLHYDVSSAAGIKSVGLDFNGEFLGFAISDVTESVWDGNNLLATAYVSCDLAGCDRTDEISLDGVYNNLYIQKDIHLGSYLGYSEASIVDQTFCQAPEPGSIALMGIGLLGAGSFLRRRTRQSLRNKQ
jgi:hypothetical protein